MSKITNETQLSLIVRFVQDLEKSLGIQYEKISFDQLWSASPPEAAEGASLEDFMSNVRDAAT